MRITRAHVVWLVVAAAVVGSYLYLRTPGTELDSVAAFDRLLARGEPVVLEFYGNT